MSVHAHALACTGFFFFLDYGTLETGFEPVAFHVAREDDISW